jgi:hypothetical protein
MARRTRSASSLDVIQVAGLPEPVEVRRHPSARRMTLRVSRIGRSIVLTVPPGSDIVEAGRFVDRHVEWVRQRLDSAPKATALADGARLPIRGVEHRIVFTGATRAQVPVRICLGQGGATERQILVSGQPEHGPRRLLDWLVAEARRDLDDSVVRHARALGLHPRRITIRDQKSRWGSCSSSGRLSFSWRLILAPPFVLDYVAAHEVAHLAEMNHSPRFWALVSRTCPRVVEAKAWLSSDGLALHAFDALD